MGATPTININVENIFAISDAGNKSLTIARLTTIPTQPPNAKITLININWLIDVDNAQPMAAIKNKSNPNNKVFNAIKAMPISGAEPPYSLRMVLPKMVFNNKATNNPKIR